MLLGTDAAGSVVEDLRRGEAFARTMSRIHVRDTNGDVVDLEELRPARHYAPADHN